MNECMYYGWNEAIWHSIRLKEMTLCWHNLHPFKSCMFILLQFIPLDLVFPVAIMSSRCIHYSCKCEGGGLDSATKLRVTWIYIKLSKYPSCQFLFWSIGHLIKFWRNQTRVIKNMQTRWWYHKKIYVLLALTQMQHWKFTNL